MNKLRRTGAVVALSLTLTISVFAGIIHSPGAATPPPPPPEETSTTSTATTAATTTLLLTILSLLP